MNTTFSLPDAVLAGAEIKPVHVLPYRHEEPLFWICTYFAVTMWLMMLIFTLGLIIPLMLLLALLGMFAHSLMIAWLKGNSVKVTAEQFPDLHALYGQTCTRLAIGKQPELYLAQSDGMLNAMATRFMRRDYVVLLSAVVDALVDRPQAIKFYMGHELGHIKRKHLSRHWWLCLACSRLADVSSAVDDYMDANKNQAPATLVELGKNKELDTDAVEYQVIEPRKQGKSAPGAGVQVLLQTPVDCESCSDGKPSLQLRKNAQGIWSCHGTSIKEDVLKKLPFECEPN